MLAAWNFLELVARAVGAGADLPSGVATAAAEQIEEVLASPGRADLMEASDRLVACVHAALAVAPPETLVAIQGGEGASAAVRAAYILGQFSFAQMLVSQSAVRRADDRFLQTLTSPRYRRYVAALMAADCSGQDLAEATREREETVSRKLRALRELGIAEWRREGTHIVNFLTPAARSAAACVPSLAKSARWRLG
jgi:DNA-binding transcriptional ArsR family regulator